MGQRKKKDQRTHSIMEEELSINKKIDYIGFYEISTYLLSTKKK